LQSGVRVVREHLSDPRVDAVSAFRVVSEVMEIMLHSHAQLGAIAEIAESLLAAVFSHPSLSKDRACEAAELIVERMLDSIFAAAEQSFFERDYALQKHGIWSRHLIGAVRRASEASHKSIDDLLNQSPRVRNLFCSQPPRLIYAGPKRP
jgi:hypothetical protein